MKTLNETDVQVLLDHPRGEGLVVSCYADTSVAQGFEPHWLGHFKSEVSRLRQALADDDEAREECEHNLKAIRTAFDTPEVHRAHGLAVISAARRGLFRSFPLAVPVEHRLVLDEEPYLVPLIAAFERQRECLVVLADSHRAKLYAATPSSTRLLADIDEIVPKQRRASGQRRGKEQGLGIARHRQDAIQHFQKDLASRVEKAWAEGAYRGIILLGPQKSVDQFRERVPQRLAGQVLHQDTYAWNGQRTAIADVAQTAISEATQAHGRRTLDELRNRLEEGRGAVAGPQEVFDALRNGRAASLVVGPDPGLAASRCTACHWVFASDQPTCTFCHAPCEKTNLWQQVLSLALRHNVAVHFVKPDATLSRSGGVAALLSRED